MPLLWNLLTGSISQQPIDLISPLMQKVHQGQMWYLPLKYRRISQIAHAERVRPSARTRYQPRRAEEKETVSGDWFCNLQRGLLYGTNWVRNVMCHFLWLHGSGCFCFFHPYSPLPLLSLHSQTLVLHCKCLPLHKSRERSLYSVVQCFYAAPRLSM